MFNVKLLPLLLTALQVREVSRNDSGAVLLVRMKLEAESPDPAVVPFAKKAISALLSESRARLQDDGPNSHKVRSKVDLSSGLYTFQLLGGETEERVEAIATQAGVILETTKDPAAIVRKLREEVCGKARTVRISGSVVGSPDANIVEGELSLVWQIEARVSPDELASLATMMHSENLVLDCVSDQAELDLSGIGDPDEPEAKKGKGKGGAPKAPRGSSAGASGASGSSAGTAGTGRAKGGARSSSVLQ